MRRGSQQAWLRGVLLTGVLHIGWCGVGAEEPDVMLRAWESCHHEGFRLAGRRAALQARSDSLAAARRQAAIAGDEGAERQWLAEGEELADSLRAVGAAALAQELLCARLAGELDVGLRAQLRGIEGDAGGTHPRRVDSLLALQERLAAGGGSTLQTEFTPPDLATADPPEVVRAKAAFVHDLIDRIDRWLALTARTRERWAQRRLMAEQALFRDDQGFFDDPVVLIGEGSGERPDADLAGASRGGFARLLERMPGEIGAGEDPEAILDLLEAWLSERRGELARRAAEMDAEAVRRESEP
ncbi:MAG: hypothetical protein KAY32_04355 [Candidatus Eisenbacteria sp.]|nr:hypothetical protein [Candidatus Eisenbacteria bacterium]